MKRVTLRRRTALLSGVAALAAPAVLRAQSDPIKIATLTPLTGAGGPYGPVMAKVAASVVDEVNAAGGVLGRRIQLTSEDDQTNPDAGVRAARKLIDVDKVAAIMGTWASSVTTAVAPLCWESKTFLCTVSGADSITQLPHQGFLVRTQPNSTLQVARSGTFMLSLGAKKIYTMIPQTPFTQTTFDLMGKLVAKAGATHQGLIYDDKKTTYRTEVDQVLRSNPDMIFAAGYTPDTIILLKDLYRAGFKGKIIGFGYAINQKLVDQIGQPEVVEGVYAYSPSPDEGSKAYERVKKATGLANPDPYTCQVYDHVNLVLMAIAQGKAATGVGIKDNIRAVAQGGGTAVDNAVDGLKAIAAGQKVDYSGASGPCDFDDKGDIIDCKFRYDQIKGGKFTLVKIG
ncbi:branched-chain amino acid transport system substrate-binding protein [Enhydrobacter aerosaccus]|uniref:Branched-chain amino acid transport system substrate-binding protein n=1 Tax=Enhydrobacter aerosaccus TaxID=225324 RepID=A0A1T4KC29_9HYPH|nr:ABC transporter substrate-binding protein [Enhydrobacter aerosaccus]SJZ39883.1 branched-chain amino acid transport system substrate-binding protein [Enhydrobacter aerosaccus]